MKNGGLIIKKITKLFTENFWMEKDNQLAKGQQQLVFFVKVLIVSIRNFGEKQLSKKAIVLSFYSLLSIVPIVAVIFAIAKGFGFEEIIEQTLHERFKGQESVIESITSFSKNLLGRTKSGILAVVSIGMLLWSVLKVLGNIEGALNDVWKVKKSRTFIRKISDYFSILFTTPILFLVSTTLTVYITTQTKGLIESFEILGFFSPIIFFLLKLLPYIVISGAFTFLFLVIPNTRVVPKSAFLAGVIAGVGFQIIQWAYINSQIWVSGYNAIYGSLAALPLFIIWLNISWQIILLGAEVSFTAQNINQYKTLSHQVVLNHRYKIFLANVIVTKIVKNFEAAKPPLSALELSVETNIPKEIIADICYKLSKEGIISILDIKNGKEGFLPSINVGKITISSIISKLENSGKTNVFNLKNDEAKKIMLVLDKLYAELEKSSQNITLLKV